MPERLVWHCLLYCHPAVCNVWYIAVPKAFWLLGNAVLFFGSQDKVLLLNGFNKATMAVSLWKLLALCCKPVFGFVLQACVGWMVQAFFGLCGKSHAGFVVQAFFWAIWFGKCASLYVAVCSLQHVFCNPYGHHNALWLQVNDIHVPTTTYMT